MQDEFTLPLDVLLTWKIMAGRDKDIVNGELLTNLAESEGLIRPVAARSLRTIIESRQEAKTAATIEE